MLNFPIKVIDLPGLIDMSALTLSFDAIVKKQNINHITNLYIQLGEEPKAFVQSHKREPPQPAKEQRDQPLPFHMGVHFVINQHAWWEQTRPGADRTVGQVKFVPLKPNKEETILLIGKEPQLGFRVRCSTDGKLQIKLPRSDRFRRAYSGRELPESEATKWLFRQYKPFQFMELKSLGDAILSFDEGVVRAAWLIERNHQGDYYQQHYVLIISATVA